MALELNETEERIMDGQLHLRLPEKLLTDFKAKCELMKKPHLDLVREIMEAVVEDRLTIKPNEHQKGLYK